MLFYASLILKIEKPTKALLPYYVFNWINVPQSCKACGLFVYTYIDFVLLYEG